MALLEELIKDKWLKTPAIIEAFRKVARADFLPEDLRNLAELDEALPIDEGQTISQPLTVAFMMELLQPAKGEKIMDVGAGSGWTSALLAEIIGEKGRVIALEIIPKLKDFGEKNVAKYNFIAQGRVEFLVADGSQGYQKEAPFDKILCSATVQKEIPRAWKDQLKVGGRIVTPIGQSIWLLIKKSADTFEEIEYPGFVFVPLVEK